MSSRHRGASLFEALVALAILCLGVLGVGPWQAEMAQGGDVAARRMQALQIAERDLEALRSRDPLDAAADPAQTSTDDPRYRSQRRVVPDATAGSLAWIHESVTWGDGLGGMHTLAVSTATNRAPAELSAVLVAPRDAAAGTRVFGRAPAVPVAARDRGDGRSVLPPAPGTAISFVFDNGSGRIAARCTGALTTECAALDALSVSGWIRVSLATPPDAVHPDDTPLPLSVALGLTQGRLAEPGCVIERRDGALAYHCVIETDGGTWSGRSDVLAQGYVVCRYAPSHPERYDHIDRPLMQQNFLVIRNGQSCPVVPPSPSLPDGMLTLAHQP
jgi:type II secretory pathway pseudopilin PulG